MAPLQFLKLRAPQRYSLCADESLARADLKFQVSTFGHCSYFVFRGCVGAVGFLPTHIDDVPSFGEPDIQFKVRKYSGRRFGGLNVREHSSVHAGMELPQAIDLSIQLT